jgi:ectoine hydroxylase-related dioxygenase (phytanoyl-CoA dioxygenase family)
VSLELGPGDLLVRSARIFHATWKNESSQGRLMHHWLFREQESDNHRFRFEEYLTPELIEQLTDEQREVLWLGRDFALDPKYAKERERELGRVRWSTVS